MRKVILFIAMSLDGYIADKNGNVDWLNGQSKSEESIDTFSIFIKDIRLYSRKKALVILSVN